LSTCRLKQEKYAGDIVETVKSGAQPSEHSFGQITYVEQPMNDMVK
jgi:hypothetical protein